MNAWRHDVPGNDASRHAARQAGGMSPRHPAGTGAAGGVAQVGAAGAAQDDIFGSLMTGMKAAMPGVAGASSGQQPQPSHGAGMQGHMAPMVGVPMGSLLMHGAPMAGIGPQECVGGNQFL